MTGIELLPPTQQAALGALCRGRLTFRGNAAGYLQPDGTSHPVRTVRALSRAGLVSLEDGGAELTEQGRALVEGTLS